MVHINKKVDVVNYKEKGQNLLLIKFKYDDELIHLCKSIGCRWGIKNRSWYLNKLQYLQVQHTHRRRNTEITVILGTRVMYGERRSSTSSQLWSLVT